MKPLEALTKREALDFARRRLVSVCLEERPALYEMGVHLTNTLVTHDGEDDEVAAYLMDLGRSLQIVVNAIDVVALTERDRAREARKNGQRA